MFYIVLGAVASTITIISFFLKKNKDDSKEPKVRMDIEIHSTRYPGFYLRNIGEDTATEIEIENKELECSYSDVTLSPKGKKAGDKFKPQFSKLYILKAKEPKKEIDILMDSNERRPVKIIGYMSPDDLPKEGKEVRITYKNSKGKGRFTSMKISRKGPEDIKFGKLEMNTREKIRKWLSEKLTKLNKSSKYV